MQHVGEVHSPWRQGWQPWAYRLLMSALAVTLCAFAVLGSGNRLPFAANCTLTLCRLSPDPTQSTTVPVRSGDRVFFAEQSPVGRMVLIYGNVPRAQRYLLWVRRGAVRFPLTVRTVRARRDGQLAEKGVTTFALIFALLMLWRGDNAVSQGLGLFAFCTVLARGLLAITLPPPWSLVAVNLASGLGGPGAFIGLYLTATALIRPDLGGLKLSPPFLAYLANLVLLYAGEAIPQFLILDSLNAPVWWEFGQFAPLLCAVIAWGMPLVYLILGYRRSGPDSRLRIRWFIASVSLLLPLIALNIALGSDRGLPTTLFDILQTTGILISIAVFALLSYAALSQRLVAVRFVINRALVFALLTAILVGTLSLVESLIERSVVSKDAGLALNLAVPLMLGLFINRIHRWGEENVERVIFRKEYRARSNILTFLKDAAFIAEPKTLYARTVEVFAANAGGNYAAIYMASGPFYERAAASADARGLPERLQIDDEGMVRLRATLAPLDLATLSSELGASGLALPLAVRGRIEGVLVCGAKAEGRYAQAEIEFLEKAAAGVANCVLALRAELNGYLSQTSASGSAKTDAPLQSASGVIGT